MDTFGIVSLIVIASVAFIATQTVAILLLLRWNNELRSRVENLQPPF